MPSWVKDDAKWERAKEIAKKQYGGSEDDKFWSIVTGIYKKMGGEVMHKAIVFLKGHVAGYTRQDGAYVPPHEDKRQRHDNVFEDDMHQQAMWLDERATEHGFSGVNDLLTKDPGLFSRLAQGWRTSHPQMAKAIDSLSKSHHATGEMRKAALFLKTHVSGYTRKDGTYVEPHEDRRTSARAEDQDEPIWDASQASSVIKHHMEEDDDFADFGLRVIPSGHEVKPGAALPASRRWDDGIDTGEELRGTSTIGINSVANIHRAIADIMRGYPGEQIALVKGEGKGSGEDAGETLIKDATVVATWRLPGTSKNAAGDGGMNKAHPAATGWREPTPAQAEAGNYHKPIMRWNGLEIAIENPAGTVRRGNGWQTRMVYDYGYVKRSEAVDGDEVDVYVGPNLEAPMVYVVHQRKYGDWDAYDEDKCMIGFDSEDDARAAYLQHYDDPRFLGPITAMPVAEFIEKVHATHDKPAMIKGMVLFFSLSGRGTALA